MLLYLFPVCGVLLFLYLAPTWYDQLLVSRRAHPTGPPKRIDRLIGKMADAVQADDGGQGQGHHQSVGGQHEQTF